MQDVQPLNGGVVGGGRVLLRKLHQHHHGNFQSQNHHLQEQALKCPRCDSLNTKFCYYNNYNLSQPRHFCKNCRRYWTKGGVLRNVPVGGGCRKSKRSSSSSSKSKSSTNSSPKRSTQNSHSSSESSITTTAAPASSGGGGLFQIPEVENFRMSSSFEPLVNSSRIGEFINIINNNDNSTSGGFENVPAAATTSFTEYLQNQGVVQEEWDMGKNFCGVHNNEEDNTKIDHLIDPTVRIEDLMQNRGANMDLTSLDWHLTAGKNNNNNNHHQGLFDIPDNSITLDHHHHHQDYWNQHQSTSAVNLHHDHHHQWSDSTTSHLPLFIP